MTSHANRESDSRPGMTTPFTEYVRHVLMRYEGEVALAWDEWDRAGGPLPRDKLLWPPQYAINVHQRQKLSSLAASGATPKPGDLFTDDVDLTSFGNSTILAHTSGGHWRRRGGAITRGEVSHNFGERLNAQELFFSYYHAEKLCKKRAHAHGSEEVREAAQVRM